MSDSTAKRSHRAARRRAERDQRKHQDGPHGVKVGKSWKAHAWEWIKAIAWALGVALIIRQFLFQAFRIPTGSMKDTLLINDYLFVNKLTYGPNTPVRVGIPFWKQAQVEIPYTRLPGFREPRQGDIIVFEFPRETDPVFAQAHGAAYEKAGGSDYIKRCVAVGGDVVQVRDGVLYVNDEAYESNFAETDGDHSCVPDWKNSLGCHEPHSRRVKNWRAGGPNWTFGPYEVPADHYFMMGDNRFNSLDSRFWGPVHERFLVGRAEIIYWSFPENSLPLIPRFDRLLKLIDLPPGRDWQQHLARIGFVLAVAGVTVYYRRRDRKKAAVEPDPEE